jgi:hypothetical protein
MSHRYRTGGQVGFSAVLLATCAGCAGGRVPRSAAIDQAELVRSAAFDHACPPTEVRVLERELADGLDTAVFTVEVCGNARRYKRVGSMYFDATEREAVAERATP